MTEICGKRPTARRYGSRSVAGSSIAITCGRSRKIARRTSTANSSRPGTTRKNVKRPRCKLPKSGRENAGSFDISQGLFAQRFDDGGFERRRLMILLGRKALQLDGEPPDVDAVAHGVALVGGMRLLQKIGDVLEH